MNMRVFNILLILTMWSVVQAQYKALVSNYIQTYRDIAITEMDRTGIPASIKLAQGILESGAGRSELAINSNNHFGIKCGKDWTGATYSLEDDDFDSAGTLTKSCFRVYNDPRESFIDHSEFLRNPAKNSRYGFLFALDKKDYKAWAHGLKKAGYATNPKYADILIRAIEEYRLYEYDEVSSFDILASADSSHPVPPAYNEKEQKDQRKTNKLVAINDVKVVLVRDGGSLNDIAEQYNIGIKRLKEYNKQIKSPASSLAHDTKVFLQPRRAAYRGKNKWHYVKENETMASIAEEYALKEASLLRRNHLKPKEEPAIGERVALRGWAMFSKKPVLRSTKKSILPKKPTKSLPQDEDKSKEQVVQKPISVTTQINNAPKTPPASQPETKSTTKMPATPSYHLVEKGDTLYKLSKQYNVSIEDIKALNKLADESIKLGQELRIK